MKVRRPHDQIILFESEGRTEHNRKFIRIQEFYESPYPEIKGKYFTLKQYIPIYKKDHDGKFTYYDDWCGHNIDGNTLTGFYDTFPEDKLTAFELALKRMLQKEKLLYGKMRYCIICYELGDANTLNHELCHAAFHISKSYREKMTLLVSQLPVKMRESMAQHLRKDYAEASIVDEIHAYCSAESMPYLTQEFKLNPKEVDWLLVHHMQLVAEKFRNKMDL